MNVAVYRHVLGAWGRLPLYWAGFVLEAIRSILLRVVIVILIARIAEFLAAGNSSEAQVYIGYFVTTYVLGVLLGAFGDFVVLRAENTEYGRCAKKFFHKQTHKDMNFYRDNQTGYLVGLYRQYSDSAVLFARFIRIDLVRTVISLLIPTIILWSADWRIGLASVAVVVVQVAYIVWSSAQAHVYRVRAHEIYRKASGEISDAITNIVAYRSGNSDTGRSRVHRLIEEENEAYIQRFKMQVLFDVPRDLITVAGVSAALFFVVSGAAGGSAAVGLVVLTLTYMFQLMRTISDLPELIVRHDNLVTKLYPTLAYLEDTHETIRDPEHPQPFVVTDGRIEIDHVAFRYHSQNKGHVYEVFDDLTVAIRGGERVGIVGLSGAGKSTLTSLLMRFDDVDGGAIRIDGSDIRDIAQSDLRRHISYVPQEPLLFHRTIRENIAYYNDSATEADVVRAAKAAHAHEFIERLPEGYDSMVGERGIKLSGGQKQRIVIARAILKNAPIMIFDEATSALDTESERIIQDAFPEIIGVHTALVIAHRLSTVAGLDRILVMHDGKIEEDGTHDELIAARGRYWSLWNTQTNGRGALTNV